MLVIFSIKKLCIFEFSGVVSPKFRDFLKLLPKRKDSIEMRGHRNLDQYFDGSVSWGTYRVDANLQKAPDLPSLPGGARYMIVNPINGEVVGEYGEAEDPTFKPPAPLSSAMKYKPKKRNFIMYWHRQRDPEYLRGLAPGMLFRASYLFTCLNNQNTLVSKTQNLLVVQDLPDLLKISKSAVDKTITCLKDASIITVSDNGVISSGKTIFYKGKISRGERKRMNTIGMRNVRLFTSSIQYIYQHTTHQKQRTVGLVFRLIPYLSRMNNFVCDYLSGEYIHELTMPHIASILGMGTKNAYDALDALQEITFPIGGEKQPLIEVVKTGDARTIMVNPNFCSFVDYCYANPEDSEDPELVDESEEMTD